VIALNESSYCKWKVVIALTMLALAIIRLLFGDELNNNSRCSGI